MADFVWSARSGLERVAPAEAGSSAGSVRIARLECPPLVLVIARRGRWAEVAERTAALAGVTPAEGRFVEAGEASGIWTGLGQFLLASGHRATNVADLEQHFEGVASISDQSDARILFEVSGAGARDVLCRLCSLDLDDSVFPAGACAATAMDHVAVNFWRAIDGPEGAPSYRILVARSYAASLWGSIMIAAGDIHAK